MGDAEALISFFLLVLRSEHYWLWLKGNIDFYLCGPRVWLPQTLTSPFCLFISLSMCFFQTLSLSLCGNPPDIFRTLICCLQLALAGRQPVRRWHLRKSFIIHQTYPPRRSHSSFRKRKKVWVGVIACEIYPSHHFLAKSLFSPSHLLFSPGNGTFESELKWRHLGLGFNIMSIPNMYLIINSICFREGQMSMWSL